MQAVVHHALYNEMQAGDMYSTLFTERPFTPTSQRDQFCKMMFETYSLPAISFALPEMLASWAGGRTTALVVDIGHGVMTIMPIVKGYIIRAGVVRVNFSGADLTQFLQKMLTERGYYLNTSQETEIVRDMKEKLCYVTLDYETEMQTSMCSVQLARTYAMPDGQVITLANDFDVPKPCFSHH
eukprot:TRINITY_DN11225_c0_g1_i1.p1 TRINITY_DN11225_c0_g1~~TRINITY_DN11225_c0_g1_i1.p1  ORF type:complete len:183 (+),score=9.84 TRINITY_DN11225_c0_g1_i1:513-1061(+)